MGNRDVERGLVVVGQKKAFQIASEYSPVIYQEFKALEDFLTGIVLDTDENVRSQLPRLIVSPIVYFAVREDERWYYCFYMLFHPFDWSSSGIPVLRRADSHKYDTESVLIRILKIRPRVRDIATVFHNQIKFQRNSDGEVFVEAEGHGIRPLEAKYLDSADKYLVYRHYSLRNLMLLKSKQWEKLKREFNKHKVKMPDQMVDAVMARSVFGRRHKRGDIWHRPDVLFEFAKSKGRLE